MAISFDRTGSPFHGTSGQATDEVTLEHDE